MPTIIVLLSAHAQISMQNELAIACLLEMRFRVVQSTLRSVSLCARAMALSSQSSSLPLTMADVREAEKRVKGHVHHTPVMTCSRLDSESGHSLFFKCEIFQKAGSFKIRGATNMIKKRFPDGSDVSGAVVLTHSSGNHAQAVALAGRQCGVTAHIVMPKSSPAVKIAAVLEYGGKIVFCENNEQARIKTADEVLSSLGPKAVMIPSSNHPDIMAGQGTIATELLDQVPDLDVIVASASVGGMLAGISVAAKAISPGVKVVAAEPANADDIARSFAAGRRESNTSPPVTVADALKLSVGDISWPVLHANLSGVVTVTEQEIIYTTKLVWERMKLVIEPSAAVAVAAVLNPQFRQIVGPGSMRVGVVLCGGNVDLDNLPWIT